MKRHELEHILRAAGAITGASEIIVVGSQSILGALPDAPISVLRPMEAPAQGLSSIVFCRRNKDTENLPMHPRGRIPKGMMIFD